MKRIFAILLAAAVLAPCLLTGCSSTTMEVLPADENYEYYFDATVTDVYANNHLQVECIASNCGSVTVGSRVSFSLTSAKEADSLQSAAVGDNIRIYFDGMVMETYPLQLAVVYLVEAI